MLWVYAHPDPRSRGGALRDVGIGALRDAGHEVVESDLYAMGWDPVVRHEDFAHDPAERLDVLTESQRALEDGSLHQDIRAEQEKLLWSDTLVVQFPLWWFGMPAILKGWFDRLFVQGFAVRGACGANHGHRVTASGRSEPARSGPIVLDPETGRPRRYGDGGLAGRRAMVITTVGANAATTGPRGIHGELDEVLFPITHGTFWYSGMRVLAPFVVNGSVRLSEPEYADAAKRLTERLVALPDAETVSYRHQNGGDYFEHCSKVRPTSVDDVTHPGKDRPVGLFRTVLAEHLVLRDQHAPGETGVGIHQTGDVRCGRSGGDGEAPR